MYLGLEEQRTRTLIDLLHNMFARRESFRQHKKIYFTNSKVLDKRNISKHRRNQRCSRTSSERAEKKEALNPLCAKKLAFIAVKR